MARISSAAGALRADTRLAVHTAAAIANARANGCR
jgi:hypothetical protein